MTVHALEMVNRLYSTILCSNTELRHQILFFNFVYNKLKAFVESYSGQVPRMSRFEGLISTFACLSLQAMYTKVSALLRQ